MSAYTTPITRAPGLTASAAEFNTYLRDNQRTLYNDSLALALAARESTLATGIRGTSYAPMVSAQIALRKESNVLFFLSTLPRGGRTGWGNSSNDYALRTGAGAWKELSSMFGDPNSTYQMPFFRVLTGLPAGNTWVSFGIRKGWGDRNNEYMSASGFSMSLEQLPPSG